MLACMHAHMCLCIYMHSCAYTHVHACMCMHACIGLTSNSVYSFMEFRPILKRGGREGRKSLNRKLPSQIMTFQRFLKINLYNDHQSNSLSILSSQIRSFYVGRSVGRSVGRCVGLSVEKISNGGFVIMC